MANNKMLIEERSADIGNFLVGRLLPVRQKRQVGPFTFIDHMGPTTLGNGKYVDVDQHPHIGLSTLTYLLEGEIEHKDSTGAQQVISAGDVGFMSAGSGVTHTERTPQSSRTESLFQMQGYQVWVALPKEKEEMQPKFQFVPKKELPTWEQDNLQMTLVAGIGFGKESPLKVYSPLFMLDVRATKEKTCFEVHGQLQGEIAMVVAKGEISTGEHTVGAGQMLISKTDDECIVTLEKDTILLLFGGKPLAEERFLYWNFVSSSKERLERAKEDWKQKLFPKVPGDNTYIPLPGR